MRMVAAIIAVVTGLGFGVPGVIGAHYFAQRGSVWTFVGFPTYGGGPFERLGLPTSVLLLAGFVAVCAAEVILGVLLAAGCRSAPWLSLALLPLELAYWFGFALPFGFILGALRVAAVVAALKAGT